MNGLYKAQLVSAWLLQCAIRSGDIPSEFLVCASGCGEVIYVDERLSRSERRVMCGHFVLEPRESAAGRRDSESYRVERETPGTLSGLESEDRWRYEELIDRIMQNTQLILSVRINLRRRLLMRTQTLIPTRDKMALAFQTTLKAGTKGLGFDKASY